MRRLHLHHFEANDVRAIIGGIVARRQPLAFVDVAASPAIRAMPSMLAPAAIAVNMVLGFVTALAAGPAVRPFRWHRLAWTYAVPLTPLVFAWDGTVSALRAYSPEEPRELAASCRAAMSTSGTRGAPAGFSTGPAGHADSGRYLPAWRRPRVEPGRPLCWIDFST